MKEWLNKLVGSLTGVSSKRVCGILAWIVIIGIFIYCAIVDRQAPIMVDTLIFGALGLLGIDSVTGIWKNGQNTEKGDSN